MILQPAAKFELETENQTEKFHEELDAIVEKINAMKTTWTATSYPRWKSMSFEQIKAMNGALPIDEEHSLPVRHVESNADIPESFDSATQWPKCASINEVRDQANCGSCWAFGAAEAITDRYCIASGQTTNTRISMEDLLTCCTNCGFGCGGGYTTLAWQWWATKGLVTGDTHEDTDWCQNYFIPSCKLSCPGVEEVAPVCSKTCNAGYANTYTADLHVGKSAFTLPRNVAAIQTEILTNGPVETQFTVYQDFYSYKGGVYKHKTGQALGGHAVKIVGWGVDGTTPYWKIANSWSALWGEAGFFRIYRGTNECGIEGTVVGGLV